MSTQERKPQPSLECPLKSEENIESYGLNNRTSKKSDEAKPFLAERSLSSSAKTLQPIRNTQIEWENQRKALAERLSKNGMALRNGNLISFEDNEGKEEKIKELEEREIAAKRQTREVQAKLEKEIAILKQKLEFAEVEVKEAKQKVKDSDEFFKLFEVNDLRYQQHPIFKQKFQQLNDLHNQELQMKQREIDQLLAQLREKVEQEEYEKELKHQDLVKRNKRDSNLPNIGGSSRSPSISSEQNQPNRQIQSTKFQQTEAMKKEQLEESDKFTKELKKKDDIILKMTEQLQVFEKQQQGTFKITHQQQQQEIEKRVEDSEKAIQKKEEVIERQTQEIEMVQSHLKQLEKLLLDNRDAYYKERTVLENAISKMKEENLKEVEVLKKELQNNKSAQLFEEMRERMKVNNLLFEENNKEIGDLNQQIQDYAKQLEEQSIIMNQKEKELADQVSCNKDLQQQLHQKCWQVTEGAKQVNEYAKQLQLIKSQQANQPEIFKATNQRNEVDSNQEQQQFPQDSKIKMQQWEDDEKKQKKIQQDQEKDCQQKNQEYCQLIEKERQMRQQIEFEKNTLEEQYEELEIKCQNVTLKVAVLERQLKIQEEQGINNVKGVQEQLKMQISEFAQERQRFLETIEQLQQSISFQNIKNQELIQLCNQLEQDDKQNEKGGSRIKELQEKINEQQFIFSERENYWQQEVKKKEKNVRDLMQQIHLLEINRKQLMDQADHDEIRLSSSLRNNRESLQNGIENSTIVKSLSLEKEYLQSKLEIKDQQIGQLQQDLNDLQERFAALSKATLQLEDSRLLSQNCNKIAQQQFVNGTCSPISGQQKIRANSKYQQPSIASSQIIQSGNNYVSSDPNWQNIQYLNTSQFGGNSCIVGPSSSSMSHSSVLSSGASFLQQPQNSLNNSSYNTNSNNKNNFLNQSQINSSNQIIFGSVNHNSLYGLSQAQMLEIIEKAYSDRLIQQQTYYERKLKEDKEDTAKKQKEENVKKNRENKLLTENERLQRELSLLKAHESNSGDCKQTQQILKETAILCNEKQLRPRSHTNNNTSSSSMSSSSLLQASNTNLITNNSNKENTSTLRNEFEKNSSLFESKIMKERLPNPSISSISQIKEVQMQPNEEKKRSRSPLDKLVNQIERENNNLQNRKQKKTKPSIHNHPEVGSIIVRSKQPISQQSDQLRLPSQDSTPANKKQLNHPSPMNLFNNFKNLNSDSQFNSLNINPTNSNLFNSHNQQTQSSLFNSMIKETNPQSQGLKKSYIVNQGDNSQLYSSVSSSQVGTINKRLEKSGTESKIQFLKQSRFQKQ